MRRHDRRIAGAAAPVALARAVTVAVCVAAPLGAVASTAVAGTSAAGTMVASTAGTGTAAGPASTPAIQTVTDGASQSLGEPAAAASSAVSAVTATTFGESGARVRVWTRTAHGGRWADAGLLLPSGFTQSYDPAAAALPGGPVFVAAGTSPSVSPCPGGGWGPEDGSVEIARVLPDGSLSAATLVNDQRGTGHFDDRPAAAVGPGGTVWVAWSEGPAADMCQEVGIHDHLVVAVSHDGGRTFGTPINMPSAGGYAAFSTRLAPLGNGRVAVSWTESTGGGGEQVLVSVVGPGRQVLPPQAVLRGREPPGLLPGASFYDFPTDALAALPGGRLLAAAPFWDGGRSVIGLAAGRPGGSWRTSAVGPPPGSDLLLPALGTTSADRVMLLCAVHDRSGDRLGYDAAELRVRGDGDTGLPGGLTPVTPAPAGPGFYEIGEELFLARSPGGLLSAVVVAGHSGATLETESWATPPTASPSPSPSPATSRAATPQPGASHRGDTARGGHATDVAHQGQGWTGSLLAAIIFIMAAAAATAWVARRARGHTRR